MSLDVYLTRPGEPPTMAAGSGIYVREDGSTREISRADWDARYPGREPYIVERPEDATDTLYWANITHNLGGMAAEAGIYDALWRPDEHGMAHGRDLVGPLTDGLALLNSDPERFRKHNPSNGWGNYEGLCKFVAEYLAACQRWPDAEVSVSR